MPEGDVYFVTFCGGSFRWYLAGIRLHLESRKFTTITNSNLLTPWNPRIRDALKEANFSFKRARTEKGYGFWKWKPIILRHCMQNLPLNSVLIYLDSGCQLNSSPRSIENMNLYIDIAKNYGIVAMELDHLIGDWTKRSVIEEFSYIEDLEAKRMTQSGILFLKNVDPIRRLINEWAELSITAPELFENDIAQESSNFISHRHDQSVFSCLMIKFSLRGIPDETYFAPSWEEQGRDYPIWATRNRGLLRKR